MWGNKRVSVVLPAYNEEHSILAAIEEFLSNGVVDEMLIVDNNSTDKTAELVTHKRAILISESRQGYGFALRRGLREASGDLIIMSESDGTFLGRDVFKLLSYAEDFDMVCGTRTTKELIWKKANMGWFLRFGNLSVAKLLEFLFGGPSLSDCGCTLRLMKKEMVHTILPECTVGGSHFLPELVILGLKHGFKIIEVPVNYRGRRGVSKITGNLKGVIKTGFNMISLILQYRFFGRPIFLKRWA